jgi:hypothetical protein
MSDETPIPTPQLRLVSGWSRYPDLRDEPEHLIALDAAGREVGSVKPGSLDPGRWDWALHLGCSGAVLPQPIIGSCATRDEAAQALAQCYGDSRETADGRGGSPNARMPGS